ncbi:MAG: cytochrome c [Lysobacterales bacterium]
MREIWARRLAMASAALVLAVAAALAGWRNREQAAVTEAAPAAVAETPVDAVALRQRGAEVYRNQGCRACHSLAGQGNTRHPLDGIGARLSAQEISQWISADPAVASQLSARVRQRKAIYASLPDDDLAALVAYLAQPTDDQK